MTAIWFCWHQRDKNFLEHTDVAWDANNPIRQSNHPVLNIAVLYFYLIPSSTLLTFLILESRLLDKKVVNDCYRIGIHHASTRPVKVNSLSSNPTVPSTAASLHNSNSSFSTCCLNIFMLIFNVFYHLWQDLDQYSLILRQLWSTFFHSWKWSALLYDVYFYYCLWRVDPMRMYFFITRGVIKFM